MRQTEFDAWFMYLEVQREKEKFQTERLKTKK